MEICNDLRPRRKRKKNGRTMPSLAREKSETHGVLNLQFRIRIGKRRSRFVSYSVKTKFILAN